MDLSRAEIGLLSTNQAQFTLVFPLPVDQGLAEISSPLVYDQPTVMWRMWREGKSCHALIAPRPDGASVVWFVNDRPLGRRDFGDCGAALRWCERLQMQNWSAGWRLAE